MIETLYTKHRPWLVRWCAAMTGDADLADDLAQDTFLRAMEHIADLEELSEQQVRAWLRHTAKNRYIDLFRRSRAAPEPETEVSYQDDHTAALVAAACLALPEPERALFTMRYFEGYNSTELGELFDLSPSTVRARLASAKRKLRQFYFEE